jgi:hypothetical protein
MKFLLNLVLIAGALLLGWSVYPSMKGNMDASIKAKFTEQSKYEAYLRTQANPDRDKGPSGVSAATGAGALLATIKNSAPAKPVSADGEPEPTTAPAQPAMAATAPETPAASPADSIEARYPMPKHRTIEEVTKEWSTIPSRAFPRAVKTKVALTFDIDGKKVSLAADATARAVGMVQGMLVVMPENNNSARQLVPLANTDLKETLTALYEKFKAYKDNLVIKQRDRARALLARGSDATAAQLKLAGPKPEQAADRTVPLMLESLRGGRLKELKEANITEWQELQFEEVDGTVYWTGTVACNVESAFFGATPTEIMALMKDGKLIKWVYTGSKEEVQ